MAKRVKEIRPTVVGRARLRGLTLDKQPVSQQAVYMKATFQLPDELYREVKATAAMEGRTLRDLTIGLFEQWLRDKKRTVAPRPVVDWRNYKAPLAHLVSPDITDHSMEGIRKSITDRWNESK